MWRYLLLISILFIVACSNLATQQRLSGLDDSLNRYGAALRWAYYQDAVAYHLNQDNKRPVVDTAKFDDYSVTGFEIIEKIMSEDMTEAFIKSELVYYNKEYGTIRKLVLNQNWWYSEEAKHWFVESPFPEFK